MKKDNGYTKISNIDIERQDISGNDKLIYLLLLRFKNNKKGIAYPSQSRLADLSGLSLPTIKRCIKNLETKNVIKSVKSLGKQNIYSFTNQYHADTSITETPVSERHSTSITVIPEVVSHRYPIITKTITNDNKKSKPKKIPKKKKLVFELPGWLDKEAWAGWVEHRNVDIKKKLTDKAIKLQLKMLGKYKDQHVQIIEYSIMNGYTGLIEPKGNKSFNNNNQKPSNYDAPPEGKYDNID